MNSAVLHFPTPRVVPFKECALRVIYAAMDAYADRLVRNGETVSAERLHAMKETARLSYLGGSSKAMAISDAKHDDAVRHRVRGPVGGDAA